MSAGKQAAGPVPQQRPQAPIQIFSRAVVVLKDGNEVILENVAHQVQASPSGTHVIFEETLGDRNVYMFPLFPATEIAYVRMTPSKIDLA